jgi:hypothetical protein
MNPEEPHDEIGEMLRSSKPRVIPPAGLEARILRSLESRERPQPRRFWPWLLLPPAMAAVVLMIRPASSDRPPVARIEPPVTVAAAKVKSARWKNPLESESLAFQHDMRRAGNFLIHCLPTVPQP